MKVVQIGTGGWGKNHTRILSQLGILVAVCDTNSERSKEYGEKYSVRHYNSVEDLIQSEDFDAAFIVTPTSTQQLFLSLSCCWSGEEKWTFVTETARRLWT